MSYSASMRIDVQGQDFNEREHTAKVLRLACEAAAKAFAEVADREGGSTYTTATVSVESAKGEAFTGPTYPSTMRAYAVDGPVAVVLTVSGHVNMPPKTEGSG